MNTLHKNKSITLHRFKYVGYSQLSLIHEFRYKFEEYINKVRLINKVLTRYDGYGINKINPNKIVKDDMNIDFINKINNKVKCLASQQRYSINKFNFDKMVIGDNIYEIQINKIKLLKKIEFIQYINKINNSLKLFNNIDKPYHFINIIDYRSIKMLKHFDRDVQFINKVGNLRCFNKISGSEILKVKTYNLLSNQFNAKVINKFNKVKFISNTDIVKYINIIKINDKIMCYFNISDINIINSKLNKFLNKDIQVKEINKLDTKISWMSKLSGSELNKFKYNNQLLSSFGSYNINKFSNYLKLLNKDIKLLNINSNSVKFTDKSPLMANKTSLSDMIKYMNKNVYLIGKNYYKTMFLSKTYKDITLENIDFKFMRKGFYTLNLTNNKLKYLQKTFKDININNSSNKFMDATFKDIDINKENTFIDTTFKDICIIDNIKFIKSKCKAKISIIRPEMLMRKSFKGYILKANQWNPLKSTYSKIYKNNFNKLYEKVFIGNINKFNTLQFVSKSSQLIFKNNLKMIEQTYRNIDIIKANKLINTTYKQININMGLKGLIKDNKQSINKITNIKLLTRFNIHKINITKYIIKFLEVKRKWWIIEHDEKSYIDRLIIPNIDYPYETEPVKEISKHPIASLEDISYDDIYYGSIEIDVPIRIMQQMLNILFILWHTTKHNYAKLTGAESIEKSMYAYYYWLNIEEVRNEMINKKSFADYLRVYRWFRWESEKVWIKIKDDDKCNGLKAIGMIIAEIILYMKNHHYNIVPLTNKNNLFELDNMLEAFKIKVPDYYIHFLDKNKGKRKYQIESINKHNKGQNFVTNKNNKEEQ